jgi:hypothetical protein
MAWFAIAALLIAEVPDAVLVGAKPTVSATLVEDAPRHFTLTITAHNQHEAIFF